jgi:REP element-mobilizing transposase RayT
MKKHTLPLAPETFYHIYNRGINGEAIFKEERNYPYFLDKYGQYIEPVAKTYAYCLLGNHFHFLIRTRSIDDIASSDVIDQYDQYVSKQFSRLFISYSQTINKTYERSGSLFDRPFRRIPVHHDSYFSQLVAYIHHNPVKHGFTDDFMDYPHSSYWSHLEARKTKLKRNEMLNWFGGQNEYRNFHLQQLDRTLIKSVLIEM